MWLHFLIGMKPHFFQLIYRIFFLKLRMIIHQNIPFHEIYYYLASYITLPPTTVCNTFTFHNSFSGMVIISFSRTV